MNRALITLTALLACAGAAHANLIVNGEFDDTNTDSNYGDAWGTYGAAGFATWFPNGNPGHAVIYADQLANFGGFYQLGIAGAANLEYEFSIDAQFEAEYDASTRFGVEFYAADDATKLGEAIVEIAENPGAGYERFTMSGVAVAGTAYVRPIVMFDTVASAGSQRAATFDNAALVAVPTPASAALLGLGAFAVRRGRH